MTEYFHTRTLEPFNAKPVFDVEQYCRQKGIDKNEERKMLKLLGRFASRHELEINRSAGAPRFR